MNHGAMDVCHYLLIQGKLSSFYLKLVTTILKQERTMTDKPKQESRKKPRIYIVATLRNVACLCSRLK